MDFDDEYAAVSMRPLKLANEKGKVKKGKDKTKTKEEPQSIPPPDSSKMIVTTTTKAEEAFKARQEKIAQERILKKASKTHKQRVEEFNKHLDSLSEHYDIPKVSWTK